MAIELTLTHDIIDMNERLSRRAAPPLAAPHPQAWQNDDGSLNCSPFARCVLVDPALPAAGFFNQQTYVLIRQALEDASPLARRSSVRLGTFLGVVARIAPAVAAPEEHWASRAAAEQIRQDICAWLGMHKKDGMLDELVRAAIAEDAENEAQMSGTEHDARTPRCVPAGVPLLDYTLDRLLHAIAGPDQLFGAVMSVRSLNEWACGMGREAHGLTAAPEPLQPAPTPEQALQTCAKAPEPLALGDSACSVPTLVGVYEDVLLVESGQRLDGLLPEAAAPVPDEQAVPQGMPQEWEVLDDAAWPEDAEAQEALRAGCEGSPDHDNNELPAIEPPADRAAGLELTDDEPPAGSSDRAAVLRQRMSLLAGKAKLHTALGLESPTGWRARWNGGLVAVDAADPRFQRLVVCVFAMPDPPSFRAVAAALDDAGVHDLRPVLAALKSSPGVKSISRKDSAASKIAKTLRDQSYELYAARCRRPQSEAPSASRASPAPSASSVLPRSDLPNALCDALQQEVRGGQASLPRLRQLVVDALLVHRGEEAEPRWRTVAQEYASSRGRTDEELLPALTHAAGLGGPAMCAWAEESGWGWTVIVEEVVRLANERLAAERDTFNRQVVLDDQAWHAWRLSVSHFQRALRVLQHELPERTRRRPAPTPASTAASPAKRRRNAQQPAGTSCDCFSDTAVAAIVVATEAKLTAQRAAARDLDGVAEAPRWSSTRSLIARTDEVRGDGACGWHALAAHDDQDPLEMRRSFHAALLAEPERFLLTVDADAAEPMLRSALCRSCPEHPPVGGNSDTWLDIGSMGPFLAEFLSDRLVALHPSFLSAGALQGETYLPLRLLHEPRTRVILHTGGNHFCVARLHGSSGGDNEPSSHGNQSGGRDSDDTTSGGHGSPDSLSLPPPQEWWRRAARAFQTNAWVSLGQH